MLMSSVKANVLTRLKIYVSDFCHRLLGLVSRQAKTPVMTFVPGLVMFVRRCGAPLER